MMFITCGSIILPEVSSKIEYLATFYLAYFSYEYNTLRKYFRKYSIITFEGCGRPLNCRAAGVQSERRAPRLRPERQRKHRLDSVTDQSSEFYTHWALNQAVPAHRFVVCKSDSALRNICRLLSSRARRRNFVKTVPNVKTFAEHIA
eukprot:31187-Pelagococcus_subviridis.AAC.7